MAVEPDTGLITACALTKASGADKHEVVIGTDLRNAEGEPVTVLADSGYGTGELRAVLAEAGHRAVIKPIPLRTPVPGGFTTDAFAVDLTNNTVTIWPSRGAASNGNLSLPPSGPT